MLRLSESSGIRGLPKRLKYGIPNELSLGGTGPGLARPARSQVKPAPFAYHRAHSVAEAVALLAELGEERW
jgi:hypothetical protein